MTDHELREQVALGCRILAANGHYDFIWGHVSARDSEGRGIWMKPASFGFEEVSAEDVILVGFDGGVLAGQHPRHVEWPIHTEVMRVRSDVDSVVHSHPRTRSRSARADSHCSLSPTPARCSSLRAFRVSAAPPS